jgi:hypothetical protein
VTGKPEATAATFNDEVYDFAAEASDFASSILTKLKIKLCFGLYLYAKNVNDWRDRIIYSYCLSSEFFWDY